MSDTIQDSTNIPELQSPFGQLRELDADGKRNTRIIIIGANSDLIINDI